MLSRRYFFGLIIAILVLLVNQVFVQYQLWSNSKDAYIINVSGRQRMLSQKICLEFYKIVKDQTTKSNLNNLITEWDEAQQIIEDNRFVKKSLDTQVKKDRLVETSSLINVTKTYGNLPVGEIEANLEQISANQEQFLVSMNTLVGDLESYATWKLNRLKIIEVLLLMISILIIIFELYFVFKPAVKQLSESNDILQDANQKLTDSNRIIQSKNKELEEFNYVCSNDLQKPITLINAYSKMINMEVANEGNSKIKEYIDVIIANNRDLNSKLENFKMFYKAGKFSILEKVDTNEVVEEVISGLRREYNLVDAEFNIINLPQMQAYAEEFRMLMKHLVQNAIQNAERGRKLEMDIECFTEADHFRFEVKDNGVGIKDEKKNYIFGLFEILENNLNVSGSMGIGLSYCKKIVSLHSGKIWVKDNQPFGSIFCFIIKKQS